MSRGDCFVIAFKLATADKAPGFRLCHGTVVRNTDGLHHAHAWIEYDMVYEFPNGVEATTTLAADYANGNNTVLPAEFYRKVGQAYDVVEYTADEARRLALQHEHYGPWPC